MGSMATTAIPPFTEGTVYTVTYRPTLYGRPVTKRAVTLTTVLTGYTGKRTFIFYGPRGGKLVLGEAEIVTAVA